MSTTSSRGDEVFGRIRSFLQYLFPRGPDRGLEPASGRSLPEPAAHAPIDDPASSQLTAHLTDSSPDLLQAGRENLSEKELESMASIKFLIADHDRLAAENLRLIAIEREHNELRIRHAVILEERRKTRRLEFLSSMCLSIGSTGLGVASNYMMTPATARLSLFLVVIFGILVMVGVVGLHRPASPQ